MYSDMGANPIGSTIFLGSNVNEIEDIKSAALQLLELKKVDSFEEELQSF